MTHTDSFRITSRRRSAWGCLTAKWNGTLRSMEPLAAAAVFSLAVTEAGATPAYSEQAGLWSVPGTWVNGFVPDGSGSVYLFHPVILDVNFGPGNGGVLVLSSGSLFLNPGITLIAPDDGLVVAAGSSISGPGLIDGEPFSALNLSGGTVTSVFDVTEINIYSGTPGTIRHGTAGNLFIEPSNTLRIVQEPGQLDGLTIDGNLFFQSNDGTARIALTFDPAVGLHDWALRWKGDRDDYLTGLLGTQLTVTGVPGVEIVYDFSDNYTYVFASAMNNIPEPSALGLLGVSALALLRRRR